MPMLFDPCTVGDLRLAHRIVMAPLTRNRARGTLPNALMATYYAQRADPATGAALIVSEATQVDPLGQGYLDTPGLHSAAQVAGWRQVTQAVHDRGGLIAAQLWHVGRISHGSLLPGGQRPVSSTARPAAVRTLTAQGMAPCSPPRALATDELPAIVAQFRAAAERAREAGFDAVEIHAANGYLIDQFLRDSVNDRVDAYGGTIAHRCRLLFEIAAAVAEVAGAGRTGVRLSPVTPSNDAAPDSDPAALYGHLLGGLSKLGLAWVHMIEGQTGGARDLRGVDFDALRRLHDGAWIVNNGYSAAMAEAVIADGRADLVAFGRPFIANPDLGLRLRLGADWARPDRTTFYGGGEAGYTDYPVSAM